MRDERGSATVAALGWIVTLAVLTGLLLELSVTLTTTSRLQGATDRAALAAADVFVGVGGYEPCAAARDVLIREGFSVRSCVLEQQSVRVIGEGFRGGIGHTRRAHAGVVDGG